MNKNISIVLVAGAIVLVSAFLLFGDNDAEAPSQEQENVNQQEQQQQVQGETHVISYTSEGYSPQDITINTGDTVRFENNSSTNFWPASNNHPVHNDYSEFDPRSPVGPGDSYSFTFERGGEWGYHDHLRPSFGGVISAQ